MKFLIVIQLVWWFLGYAIGDHIFSSQLANSLGRSSREAIYRIEFHAEDSPYLPDDDQESLVMSSKSGKSYVCFLPKVEKVKPDVPINQMNTSNMIVETEKYVKLKTPDELLEALKGACFRRQEGWWTYEFCYQQKLRQIHLDNNKLVQEFVLGIYDEEATTAFNTNMSEILTIKDPRSRDASQRYHPHQYKNGTICDLTNKPRETEVRFVCAEPLVMINSITEISTCKYAVTIQVPALCKHQMFMEEKPAWHTINCNLADQHDDDQHEDDVETTSLERHDVM